MGESDFSGASLKDVVCERCELREAMFSSARLQRVELRGCDLASLRGGEALRGARTSLGAVLENAVLFASLAGIESLADE